MAVAPRITQHPLWSTLEQTQNAANALAPAVAATNPALVERAKATLSYLRLVLEQANGDVIADGSLQNFHSWTQQILNELNNAQANPGQPQFLANILGAVDAISQNIGQIPVWPGPNVISSMIDEAQARLDRLQGLESETRERARIIRDHMGDELDNARTMSEHGLKSLQERGEQADALLAELGAKGTATQSFTNSVAAIISGITVTPRPAATILAIVTS